MDEARSDNSNNRPSGLKMADVEQSFVAYFTRNPPPGEPRASLARDLTGHQADAAPVTGSRVGTP